MCLAGEETIIHRLRDCNLMNQVWRALTAANTSFYSFFSDDLHDWLWSNLTSTNDMHGLSWTIIFGTTISLAWQARNEWVFQNLSISAEQMVHKIKCQGHAIASSIKDHQKLSPCSGVKVGGGDIRWKPPATGWVKLNCEGSVINFGSQASGGGVLRSDDGVFLFGYACGLGPCSITEAELWAILKGLQIARSCGFSRILIETDSLAAVRLISLDCSPLHSSNNVVQDIRVIMIDCDARLKHVFREANQVVDGFSKYGHSLQSCAIFQSLSSFVSLAFQADCNGV